MVASTTRERMLMARVARRYYLDDHSKSDIAADLGISRFRVARLIDAARREGVVTIRVESPAGVDDELSAALQQRFGLAHAVVIDVEDDEPESLRQRLSLVAAELMRDIVSRDDVLGLAWARSLRDVGAAVNGLAPCPVVQLTGALPGPDGSDVLELVRRVAQASGGIPHVFYAPLIAPDTASARALRRQPDVARAAELTAEVTVAFVGIGAWEAESSTIFDGFGATDVSRARALGAVGEISGALIDADGRPLRTPLARRIIAATGQQLDEIATVVSVAYGRRKAPAVAAALRGGLVNGLVTHAGLARQLLDDNGASDNGARDTGPRDNAARDTRPRDNAAPNGRGRAVRR